MTSVLLATFSLLPDGEPGGEQLVAALAGRDVDARWVCWDDHDLDWSSADLVAVRSTWDYTRRADEFLQWSRWVEQRALLLNGSRVFEWNIDKAYLLDLAGRVPVVPTRLVDDANLLPGLAVAIADFGTVVVKSRTGAGGLGVVVAERTDDPRLSGLNSGPWAVQPLVESVRSEGETSVFVIDGEMVSQVHKLPAGEEIRVHEAYGGASCPVRLTDEHAALAGRAMQAGAEVLGRSLDYGRVDMMRLGDGTLAVSELELIEPGLYLDVSPENAQPFADLVLRRIAD
ncbi:MAG: hypothetical protein L0H93_17560 [Nocardioides sp.]|nr:hypothetical protein [Nocardioides sp.]